MNALVRLFVGYDPREAAAYHVFCQSVIDHASIPVAFIPLTGPTDGTNAFTLARYRVPQLCDFRGWAIFADSDMVVSTDIKELWDLKPMMQAVSVVKHDYQTREPRKYVGSKMEAANTDYPRKNWSSLMLWHCGHFANQVLTDEFLSTATPQSLHRLQWLKDEQIGALPADWNYLVGEYAPSKALNYHYTLGVPGIAHYADTHASWHWHRTLLRSLECAGEDPTEMVARAQDRIGAVY